MDVAVYNTSIVATSASGGAIVIAVIVGGLISGTCLIAVGYFVMKTFCKKGKTENEIPEEEDEMNDE